MKVLLQERDETMRAVIRPMLASGEIHVIEAGDPWEAAALAGRQLPDVVLLSATDVYECGRDMPRLLSSVSTGAALLLVGASQPRIAQTPRLPVDGYLPYPFDAPRLAEAMESAINTRGGRGEPALSWR